MATVMQSHHVIHPRATVQKVCIGTGIFLVVLGLIGLAKPGFMNMHLSLMHNVIHLFAGGLAIWSGYSDHPRKSYGFAMGFGAFFGLLGIVGLFLGEPGYPGVGHMEADENLFRIVPNALEFGTFDHILHLVLSIVLFVSAYSWLRHRDDGGHSK